MSDAPIQIIVAAFQDQQAASDTLKQLQQARKGGLINIIDAAVLSKDAKGKVKIKETADAKADKGFAIGAITGGVLSLLAGPLGLMALGGGLVGGLAAKLKDGGFKETRLKQLTESLTPNSSALIAVVEHSWVTQVENLLADAATQVVTEALGADIAAQLEAGGEVVYSVADTGEEILADRLATNPIPPEMKAEKP
jgi:uncharacterized membrane protein